MNSNPIDPDHMKSAVLIEPATAGQLIDDTATSAQWLARYDASLMGVFGGPSRVLVRGSGCYVWDADGKQYLDLLAGIAVNALGHAHPFLTSVISSQLATLNHVSNFFTSPVQIALAEKMLSLTQAPSGSTVFFSNSGTEANEAAVKLARSYGNAHNKPRILALEGGFHGRSTGALALTYKEAYRKPFEPLPPNVEHLPFGDIDALERALAAGDVSALVLEPIQGEAGVIPLPQGYLAQARALTRAAGALLIVDEVQTGAFRTGEWLAYPLAYGPNFNAATDLPDAITLAKGLGGGFPIGALIAIGETTSHILGAGTHGTTFGGNPPAMAAALATISVIESSSIDRHTRELGAWLRAELRALPHVTQVRGEGLLIGIELDQECAPALVTAALEAGFIVNAPKPATVRLAPPLILTQEQAQSFLDALVPLIDSLSEGAA